MQTFLPFADFAESAACLDRQRLGKQRVEVLQILRALLGESSGWRNHPAVRMWRGYHPALLHYGLIICEEWTGRGYRDTCYDKLWDAAGVSVLPHIDTKTKPPWLGNPAFHLSHRSNLIRKNPEHYRPLFPADTPDDLPYVWPI